MTAGLPPCYRLAWDGHAIGIASDEPRVVALIDRYLAIAPIAVAADALPAATLVRQSQGYRASGAAGTARLRSWPAAAYWLLEAVAYGFTLAAPRLLVHAGAFVGPKGAVVYVGLPQAGKSSLSFAAWRRGLPVIGDDRIAMVGDAARAFPKCLKVRIAPRDKSGAWAADLPTESCFAATLWGDRRLILTRRLPGVAGYGVDMPIHRLVVIERGPGTVSRMTDVPVAEAAQELLPSAGLAHHTPMDLVRLFKRHGRAGRLPRVSIGTDDFGRALDLLCAL